VKVMVFSGAAPKMPSGVGDYVGELARALRDRVELTIVTTRDAAVDPALCPGAKVLPIVAGWGISDLKPIARAIASESPDIFHQQYPSFMGGPTNRALLSNLLAPWLKLKWPSKPLLTTFHEYGERRRRWRMRAYPNLRWSDALITITARDAAILAARKAKVHRIPIMSNIPAHPSAPARFSRPTIAYFGFLEPLKGFEDFIAVAALLGDGYDYLVLGGFHPDRNPYHRGLKEQVRAARLEAVFRFAGHQGREEVAAALAASHCALLPFREGVSERRGSFLAAVVQGTPVVTTAGPFTPEGFRGVEGLALAAPGDVAGLASSVRRFCAAMPGRAGLAGLAEGISLEAIGSAHARAYAEALGR
jgi:glycosyltransferase involved in cell wall biosynthesis